MRDRRKKSRPRAAMAMAGGLVALVLGAVPAQAATINVTPGAVDNVVNGNCSIREAINAANTDTAVDACPAGAGADTINAPGTFVLTEVDNDANGLPVVTSTMTIRNATVTRASGSPAFRIFQVASTGDLTLEAVTVSGGVASCSGTNCAAQGGDIFNLGTLTVTSSRLNNNTASCSGDPCFALGGGIANVGTLTVTGSTVTGNTASCFDSGDTCGALGGGIRNDGTLTLRSSTVTDNTASCSGSLCFGVDLGAGLVAASGGGISNAGSTTVTSSRLSNNTASCSETNCAAQGGGLFNFAGTATLNSSAVTGNRAVGATAQGGGIFVAGGTVTLNSTFVSGNTPDNCEPDIPSANCF